MKRRYRQRIQYKVPVVFTMGAQLGEGHVLDLTIPGCLIESPIRVSKGQSLSLKIFLPGLEAPITVSLGVVRWSNVKQFGVEFIKMENSQGRLLNQFVGKHLSDPASPKAKRRSFSDPGGNNWHLQTYDRRSTTPCPEQPSEAMMSTLNQKVSKFVAASEALHWRLIEGDVLSAEDRNTIERTAVQLLMRVEVSTRGPVWPQGSSRDKAWKRLDDHVKQEPHP